MYYICRKQREVYINPGSRSPPHCLTHSLLDIRHTPCISTDAVHSETLGAYREIHTHVRMMLDTHVLGTRYIGARHVVDTLDTVDT